MDIRPYVIIAERRARSDGRTGIAVDLRFGSGAVPIFLLQRGWHVTAVDVDAVAVDDLHARVPKDLRPLLTVLCADFRALQLPVCKFINAGYVLQYVSPREFRKFWKNMTHLLEKNGVFAGNFFGKDDLFANYHQYSTFFSQEIEELFRGWDVFFWEEYSGMGQRNPDRKWHFFTICAQKLC